MAGAFLVRTALAKSALVSPPRAHRKRLESGRPVLKSEGSGRGVAALGPPSLSPGRCPPRLILDTGAAGRYKRGDHRGLASSGQHGVREVLGAPRGVLQPAALPDGGPAKGDTQDGPGWLSIPAGPRSCARRPPFGPGMADPKWGPRGLGEPAPDSSSRGLTPQAPSFPSGADPPPAPSGGPTHSARFTHAPRGLGRLPQASFHPPFPQDVLLLKMFLLGQDIGFQVVLLHIDVYLCSNPWFTKQVVG